MTMDITKIIKEFAETYGFLQQKDIDTVENSDFNRKNYLKIGNKKFICIETYTDKVEIAIGKIIIEIDSYDGNDWYSIDKDTLIRINIDDFPNECSLINEIVKECKKYDLI
jgi:hypothetical protein